MTGTQNHEGLAGVVAAVEYLADLGSGADRRERLLDAMRRVTAYEQELSRRILAGLAERPRFRVWGRKRPDDVAGRTPTVAVTASGRTAREMSVHLAREEIYAWDGDFYASELVERLGPEAAHGLLRLGFVHYNTSDEVDTLLASLDRLP